MLSKTEAIMKVLRAIERIFIALVLLVMSALFFINVVAREFSPRLATELAWIEAATLFAFVWLVFAGLGLTLDRRRHIAMTAFIDRAPRQRAFVVHKIINIIGLAFSLFLTKTSFDLAVFIYNSGQISPTLSISVSVLYAPLPLGFALLGLRYLLELIGAQDRFQIRDVVTE